ncbi:serine hydrolase [Flavobacterium cerinum]|uniref:serine hydrolase n=1 Tax=Flavobacterium cerinum TaxID=2502784 RepID=UPI003741EF1B
MFITKDGKTKYSKASGYSDIKKNLLLQRTIFAFSPNNKQITAVLVLKEVEKRNIDLYKSIKTYLPDLKQTWADSVGNFKNHRL